MGQVGSGGDEDEDEEDGDRDGGTITQGLYL